MPSVSFIQACRVTLGCLLVSTTAFAQRTAEVTQFETDRAATAANDPWTFVVPPLDDPDDPVVRSFIQERKRIVAAEKEMKWTRARHFRTMRNQEIRQIGLLQLREWEDPSYWPSLVEIFGGEDADVRHALLDMFEDAATDAGDAMLMWEAILDKDPEHRAEAFRRVMRRYEARLAAEDANPLPDESKKILAHALRHGEDTERTTAAIAIRELKLLEAIPLLITAQIGSTASGNRVVGVDDGQSLAWILIGRQQAYVADVTPVVGNGSVAFDPELAILTTGTVMRIIDAVVYTYHNEVHGALVDMTSEAWGQSTAGLGWDIPAWRAWYASEFVPHLDATANAAIEAPITTSSDAPVAEPSVP